MKRRSTWHIIIIVLGLQVCGTAQSPDVASVYNALELVTDQLTKGDLITALGTLKAGIEAINHEEADSALFLMINEKVHLIVDQISDNLAVDLHETWAAHLRQIFMMHQSSLEHLELAIGKAKNSVLVSELHVIKLLNQKVLALGALQDWSSAKMVLLDLAKRCEAGSHHKMLPTLYHNLGFAKIRLLEEGTHELIAGLKFLHQYDSTSPEGHNLYNTLGRQYLIKKKYRLANETFQSYVKWTNHFGFERVPRAVVGLISSHIWLGEVDQASEIEKIFLRRMVELSPIQQQEFCISISDAYIDYNPNKSVYYAKMGLDLPIDVFRTRLEFLLGFGYLELGRYSDALHQMQRYFGRIFPGYDERKIHLNPNFREANDSRIHRPLVMKGQILMELGKEKGDIDLVKFGYQSLLVGDSILQSFRSDLSRTDRHRWNQNLLYLSRWGATIANQLLRMTKHPKYKEEIFRWSEKSKSLAHLDKVNREDLWRQLDIPNELISRENELVRLIDDHISGLYNVSTDSSKMRIAHVIYQHELDLLRRKMEHEYPKYYHLQHQPPTVTIKTLQDHINRDQAVLSYFMTENKIYGFLIERDTVHYVLMEDESGQIDDDLISLHQLLQERSPSYYENARDIYMRLADPLLKKTKALDLVVITDRNLALIPFDLLVSDLGVRRYLLQDYTISQYPSASLYVRPKYNRLRNRQVLAMSPSFVGQDSLSFHRAIGSKSDLNQLPGSKEEVEVLRSIWPGKYLLDAEATESFFKQEAHQYQLIHLSSHALLNQVDEAHDGIVMAADDFNDGRLNTMEIYQLNLGAELVTLSACNTGVGKLNRVDGISSLANAFHYAGCRNILMSMWAVQDATTVEFMTSFYNLVKEGLTLPAANRQAKADFLSRANPKFHHPYYWGSFVMMGHHQPLVVSNAIVSVWWLMALPILLVLVWIISKGRIT